MNKRPNPFFPQQPAYPNPPLPPGPPPQQPQQYDYSAYWAAAQAAQQQQPGIPQPIPQWTPPQPTAGTSGAQVPSNQSSLYANYGYGGQQNFNWQRSAQQHQRQPFPIPQAPTQPSQPYYPQQPQQQQHPPSAQPGRMFPPPNAQSFPQPPQPYRPQQPMFHQQPPPPQHSPPHLPPAKRPRFEGPSIPASQPGPGMGRGGSNAMSTGGFSSSGRGGGPPNGSGTRGGASRGRGGTMGIGGGPSIGMMRGGALNNVGMRGGRGGHGPGGRGTHGGGQLAGHRGGRGGWNAQHGHSRRGAPGGGRGRGSGYSHTNHTRDGGGMMRFSAPSGPGEKERSGKKEETRQTLTDFRIVGLEIMSLDWRWGECGRSRSAAQDGDVSSSAERLKNGADRSTGDSEHALADGVEEIEFGSAIKEATATSIPLEAPALIAESTHRPMSAETPSTARTSTASTSLAGPPPPSPPRIRIYFNTPATHDESQPRIQTNGISNPRAKRKMSEEEEEGRRRRTKLNPSSENGDVALDTSPKPGDAEKDRGSVAPSVDMSASASMSGRTEDEGDWLMEAIGRDGEAVGEGTLEELTYPEEDDADAEGNDDPDVEFVDAEIIHEEQGKPSNAGTILPKVPDTLTQAADEPKTVHEPRESDEVPVLQSPLISVDDPPIVQLSSDTRTDPSPQQNDTTADSSTAVPPAVLPADPGPDPEPPASPASQSASQQSLSHTLNSSGGSFSSLTSPSHSRATTLVTPSKIPGLTIGETQLHEQKLPSANRVSISYACGARRLLIDAQVVETLKIFRGQGRIEVSLTLGREGDSELKGLLGESYSQSSQSYTRLQLPVDDPLLPPWSRIVTPSKTMLTVYLDKEKPMTEPRWVKTGDVQEWLRNTFGIFWVSGEDGWEKRIEVVDPDPPPTIHTVLENWSNSSLVGLEAERQRFVKTHMSESDNMLEILLRLVRGERATPISFSSGPSSSNLHLSGPLLTALSPSSPHASQQTHLTLAIVAMVRMAESFAERTLPGEEGKREVEERVGEIIRCLPQHLLYKSLDGIFREWKDAKKRGGRG